MKIMHFHENHARSDISDLYQMKELEAIGQCIRRSELRTRFVLGKISFLIHW